MSLRSDSTRLSGFSKLFRALRKLGLLDKMPDRTFVEWNYRARMGKPIDIDRAASFNEKLQWLKLYDRQPIYTQMVDKAAVKALVDQKLGKGYCIPTIGQWDRFRDIDFDQLPDAFVLKTTHDSGSVVICKDKKTFDDRSAEERLTKSLRTDYYAYTREWPYRDVKRQIIAEPLISDGIHNELLDYKFMCFQGEVKCCFVCSDRFSPEGLHVTFFDRDWNVMPFERHYPSRKSGLPKPENYEAMVRIAETLSKGIPFVRIDLYQVNGKTYFGEYTFYPGGGFEEFTPEEWDYTLGSWIKLPIDRATGR